MIGDRFPGLDGSTYLERSKLTICSLRLLLALGNLVSLFGFLSLLGANTSQLAMWASLGVKNYKQKFMQCWLHAFWLIEKVWLLEMKVDQIKAGNFKLRNGPVLVLCCYWFKHFDFELKKPLGADVINTF